MLRKTELSRDNLIRHGSIGVVLLLTFFFLTTSVVAIGALVGYAVNENLVAREIGANWVTFYVHTAYGIFDSNAIYLYYTTTDCSGTRYVPHYSIFAEGTRVGSQLYYPADSQVLTPQSLRVEYGSGDLGPCLAGNGLAGVYGTATTVNVDSFNVQLPFRATQ
jgi:hypothetical protein